MKNKIVSFLSCILLAGIFVSKGVAQESFTLDQVVIQVLENHPILKVADYRAQAMAARMRQAIQPPADKVTVSLENFGGTDEALAFRSVEATLSLARTLELGNKALRRGEVVQGELNILQTEKDIDRLNLLADAAQRFLHVAADQERLRLAEEALELVQFTEGTVQERILAGRTPEAQLRRVEIDLAHHELEVEHTRHELETSRVNLSTLWSELQPDFDRVEADIFSTENLPDFAVLTDLLDRNPELIRHIKSEDLARARIKLMQSRRNPDLDVSAGIRYLGGINDVAVMLWASIPLGSYGRAKPGIDEAESLSRIAPLNLEQQRLELYAMLYQIYQEMNHAREAVEKLNTQIIPAAEQMQSDYENGYQSGRYSLLELIQAQQLLRNSRSQLLEMAVSFHSHKIEIDRLTGAQLTQW
jgi:cobalt-zinc-cadmium efflux system outer membrane protein